MSLPLNAAFVPLTTSLLPLAPPQWHIPNDGTLDIGYLQHPNRDPQFGLQYLPPDRLLPVPATTSTFAAPRASRSASAAQPDPYDFLVDGEPIHHWIECFADATWTHGKSPAPETLRSKVVVALGGRKSTRGRPISSQFSQLGIYLRDLAKIRDAYLGSFAQYARTIRAAADGFMQSAAASMSRGGGARDAMADFSAHMEPRIQEMQEADRAALQQAADLERDAEIRTQHQIEEIQEFWWYRAPELSLWVPHSTHSDVVFPSIEFMERFSPPGGYGNVESSHRRSAVRGRFTYPGTDIHSVHVFLPDGRRAEVHFSGHSWRLAHPDQAPAYRFRHTNARWDTDPRTVAARVDGAHRPQG